MMTSSASRSFRILITRSSLSTTGRNANRYVTNKSNLSHQKFTPAVALLSNKLNPLGYPPSTTHQYFSTNISNNEGEPKEEKPVKIEYDDELTKKETKNMIVKEFGLSVDSYHPGQAFHQIQKNRSKHGPHKLVRSAEFKLICRSARAGHERDATIILNALKYFKANNDFILTQELASIAMSSMMKALLPEEQEKTYTDVLNAGLFVCKAFNNTKTGFYYATNVQDLEEIVLQPMVDALHTQDAIEYYDQSSRNEDIQAQVDEILLVTKKIVKMLIRRGTTKLKDMTRKKRIKHKKRLTVQGDPSPKNSTLLLATQICIALGTKEDALTGFVYHYRKFLKRQLYKKNLILLGELQGESNENSLTEHDIQVQAEAHPDAEENSDDELHHESNDEIKKH